MSESYEIKPRLTENEEYLIGKGFNKVKNELLVELNKELRSKKDTTKKSLLNKYINNLENLNPSIIKFSNAENKINGKTDLNNGIAYKITIYSKNITTQSKLGLDILLYHEFEHYIGRDKQGKLNINDNIKELNAKILTFRYYLNKKDYKISKKGIAELFKKIKREIESKNTDKKYNLFSESEETELFWIYDKFKNKKEDLLLYLQTLVKLEKLKEIYYT